MRNNVEYFEQCAVMSWANLQKCKYPELNYLHCSLAGIFLPPGLAKKAKASGNKAGVCDLFLPCKSKDMVYSGLYIEMKKPDLKRENNEFNGCSPEQIDYIEFVRKQGFRAVVCYGFTEARQEILNYLGT